MYGTARLHYCSHLIMAVPAAWQVRHSQPEGLCAAARMHCSAAWCSADPKLGWHWEQRCGYRGLWEPHHTSWFPNMPSPRRASRSLEEECSKPRGRLGQPRGSQEKPRATSSKPRGASSLRIHEGIRERSPKGSDVVEDARQVVATVRALPPSATGTATAPPGSRRSPTSWPAASAAAYCDNRDAPARRAAW